jgi:hypothetical protein
MLVSGWLTSHPRSISPAASFAALAWSSDSCVIRSSATSPAAATMPPCRTPPPSIFRTRRASSTNEDDPPTSPPIGAPSALLRHTCTVSTPTVSAAGGTESATDACHSRAPSRCTRRPTSRAVATSFACSSGGVTVPPAALCVFSRHNRVVRSR